MSYVVQPAIKESMVLWILLEKWLEMQGQYSEVKRVFLRQVFLLQICNHKIRDNYGTQKLSVRFWRRNSVATSAAEQ